MLAEGSQRFGARTGPAPALAGSAGRRAPAPAIRKRAQRLLTCSGGGGPSGPSAPLRLRRPRDATRLGHREARQQPLKVDTPAQRAQPPRLQRAAREVASAQRRPSTRRASALFAVPGGPMSSRCSPHTTDSSSRRTWGVAVSAPGRQPGSRAATAPPCHARPGPPPARATCFPPPCAGARLRRPAGAPVLVSARALARGLLSARRTCGALCSSAASRWSALARTSATAASSTACA